MQLNTIVLIVALAVLVIIVVLVVPREAWQLVFMVSLTAFLYVCFLESYVLR